MKTPDEMLRELERDEEKSSAEYGDLPPVTRLSIDVKGSRGKRYQGDFTYKVPDIGDQIRIGQLKNQYLPQGGAADPNALLLVEQSCYLEVTITDKPDWFKEPFRMYDATPMSTLYGRALEYERRFHGADEDGAEAQSAAGQPGSDANTGSDAADSASLGRKVQPSAERRETLVSHSS